MVLCSLFFTILVAASIGRFPALEGILGSPMISAMIELVVRLTVARCALIAVRPADPDHLRVVAILDDVLRRGHALITHRWLAFSDDELLRSLGQLHLVHSGPVLVVRTLVVFLRRVGPTATR